MTAMVLLTAGCVTWQAVTPAGPKIAPEDVPSRVRITLSDSSRVVLNEARLKADSIAGTAEGGAPTSVALTDVLAMEARRASIATVVVPALIVFVIYRRIDVNDVTIQ